MKNIISVITAGAFLLLINVAQAQTIADYRMMTVAQKTQLISDSLEVNLNLDKVQYKQVEVVVQETIMKIAPIIHSNSDRMEKGRMVRAILADTQVKMKAIFTPEQSVLFEAKKSKLIAYYRHKIADQPLLFNAPAN